MSDSIDKAGKANSTDSIRENRKTSVFPSLVLASFIICTVSIIIALFPRDLKPLTNVSNDHSNKNFANPPALSSVDSTLKDFTLSQLKQYNGDNDQPVYVALNGEVFDVTEDDENFGPGARYSKCVGKDCSRAFALDDFSDITVNNPQIEDLSEKEVQRMNEIIEQFRKNKDYLFIGRLSTPPEIRPFTRKELAFFNGEQAVPEGRLHAPLYIAVNGKIVDVSYGGIDFYGKGAAYNIYAGADASRSLAIMSMDPRDVENPQLTDLTPDQQASLERWTKMLCQKYPVVGYLVD